MADLAALSHISPTVVIALLLAAIVVLLVRYITGTGRTDLHEATWEPERQQLAEDLDRWAADLRVLVTSLRLAHWGDVRYALQWRTLDPPASLVDALDWESIGAQHAEALALSRVIGHAEELSRIAIVIDHVPTLQGGGAATRATVVYSAPDYANALLVLAQAADRARAELSPGPGNAALAVQRLA